jgi:hypothetical protein
MLAKTVLIALVVTSVPALADTLVVGSVYFDSQKTLDEVVQLSAQKDNDSILKLIQNGHVSQQIDSGKEIVVLAAGLTPDSPAEFRFPNEPTTYWTLTKFVAKSVEPTPTPTPPPAPTPSPTPEQSPSPTAKQKEVESENVPPFDDDHGQRIWHKVDGKWKWYPANKHHRHVKKAAPPD